MEVPATKTTAHADPEETLDAQRKEMCVPVAARLPRPPDTSCLPIWARGCSIHSKRPQPSSRVDQRWTRGLWWQLRPDGVDTRAGEGGHTC